MLSTKLYEHVKAVEAAGKKVARRTRRRDCVQTPRSKDQAPASAKGRVAQEKNELKESISADEGFGGYERFWRYARAAAGPRRTQPRSRDLGDTPQGCGGQAREGPKLKSQISSYIVTSLHRYREGDAR